MQISAVTLSNGRSHTRKFGRIDESSTKFLKSLCQNYPKYLSEISDLLKKVEKIDGFHVSADVEEEGIKLYSKVNKDDSEYLASNLLEHQNSFMVPYNLNVLIERSYKALKKLMAKEKG